jgi:transposase-like protein
MGRLPTFAQDIDLPTLIAEYGSEDKCRAYLEALRWPDGVRCPRCDGPTISRIKKRGQFDCDSCRYQFSVTAGTIFHDSHLPLWKWFLAVYVIGESKKGISSNQLKRMLGVSYKTAWYLSHRIRAAMKDEAGDLLSGVVEVDETYISGHKTHWKGREPSEDRKATVLGAVEREGRVRLKVSEHRTPNHYDLQGFIHSVVDDDAPAIMTDGHLGYVGIEDENTRHGVVNHSAGQWVQADVHTNTIEGVWSLFKRSIVGSYHHMSVKHLPSYLDEMAFRYNNRENAYLFRDTLLRLVESENLTYADLTAWGERFPLN